MQAVGDRDVLLPYIISAISILQDNDTMLQPGQTAFYMLFLRIWAAVPQESMKSYSPSSICYCSTRWDEE